MTFHDIAGVLFVVFALLHISYNLKTLMNYVKKAKEMFISKEALIAIAFVLIISGLISSHAFHAN